MLFLVGDVFVDIVQVRKTYGKGAVPSLPGKLAVIGELLVDPFRRVRFDEPQRSRN